jgi:pimeloyl-ACP methyl ester carboxylesterase
LQDDGFQAGCSPNENPFFPAQSGKKCVSLFVSFDAVGDDSQFHGLLLVPRLDFGSLRERAKSPDSGAPPSGFRIEDIARDAQGLIRKLGLRRYALVGHSMGGKIA